jgi:hypothetical protein
MKLIEMDLMHNMCQWARGGVASAHLHVKYNQDNADKSFNKNGLHVIVVCQWARGRVASIHPQVRYEQDNYNKLQLLICMPVGQRPQGQHPSASEIQAGRQYKLCNK